MMMMMMMMMTFLLTSCLVVVVVTTTGLKKWAGETDWGNNDWQPITAEFEVLSLPNKQ